MEHRPGDTGPEDRGRGLCLGDAGPRPRDRCPCLGDPGTHDADRGTRSGNPCPCDENPCPCLRDRGFYDRDRDFHDRDRCLCLRGSGLCDKGSGLRRRDRGPHDGNRCPCRPDRGPQGCATLPRSSLTEEGMHAAAARQQRVGCRVHRPGRRRRDHFRHPLRRRQRLPRAPGRAHRLDLDPHRRAHGRGVSADEPAGRRRHPRSEHVADDRRLPRARSSPSRPSSCGG
jgi:hypothetical protein